MKNNPQSSIVNSQSIVNTHSHVYDEAFDSDRDEVIRRAVSMGVEKMILPDIDSSSRNQMFAVAEQYPEHCFPMLGVHPTSVNENFQSELDAFFAELPKRNIVGIGEIGIDLYWDKTFLAEQIEVFTQQVAVAQEQNLPIVIHVRKAFNETYRELRNLPSQKFSGIFHCFPGSKEEAFKVIEMGFHIGIGGVLTFKTSHLDEVVKTVPRDKIVLETDDPYLTPVPHRGERNEPSYVTLVAEKLASIWNCSVEEVAAITTENALSIFAI
ncbi:MAG: TatD family hydrolase [Bacteroidales bacterium]|nr:TatD family hydrolase [Bacteroidales bacterium]